MRLPFGICCKAVSGLAVALVLLPAPADAALEYLRVEGVISSSYSPSHPGYDASYGFAPGQNVYFDFAFDTSAESAGRTDSGFQDYFFSDYLAGSVSGDGDPYGVTTMFPEGVTTTLFMRGTLSVGGEFEDTNGWDKQIANWVVGYDISLLSNGHDRDAIIGNVTVTYRGSTPPPAIPVPAAVWLFGSALLVLLGRARR